MGGKFFDLLLLVGIIKDGVYIFDIDKLDRFKLVEIKYVRIVMLVMFIFYFEVG